MNPDNTVPSTEKGEALQGFDKDGQRIVIATLQGQTYK